MAVETFMDRVPGEVSSADSVVELCPRCGRPGVERRSPEGRTCVHAETSELLSDGLLTEPVEACPLDPLPFDAHHRDVI